MQTGDPLQELAAFVDERLMRAGPSPWQQQPYFTEPEPEEQAMRLIRKAMIARDLSDKGVSRKSSAATIARQANAAAGGPLMTPDEFNDEIKL